MVRASGSYPEGHRFESHHRYQNQKLWHEEKYPRGRRGSPAKGVVRETVARVRLPLSPPSIRQPDKGCLFLYFETYAWQRKRACPSLMPPCGIRSLHAIGRTSFRKKAGLSRQRSLKGKSLFLRQAIPNRIRKQGLLGIFYIFNMFFVLAPLVLI